ncbi:MAG: c-type cytochrome [Candidatus Acidiferrales bacterium]
MKMLIRITGCGILLLATAFVAFTANIHKSFTAPKDADIQRGKYLVEEVAKCTECHTPRDAQGQLDHEHWMQGAPIWITPVHANPQWAERAPAIAGFGGYSDQDGVNILEKGIGANGETIRPPMHIYHMKHEDAVAIIAYLRSLPTAPQ